MDSARVLGFGTLRNATFFPTGSNGGTYGSSSSSSQQHSPLPTSAQAYYASQKQNFQFPSTQQPPRKLSSGSGGGGYGSLPVVNGKSHNTSTNISSPLPPPPPPSAGYGMGNGNVLRSSYNGVGKNEGSRNGGIQRALSHTDSVNTPPPPPPPPDVGMRTGVPEWAPKMFLEKGELRFIFRAKLFHPSEYMAFKCFYFEECHSFFILVKRYFISSIVQNHNMVFFNHDTRRVALMRRPAYNSLCKILHVIWRR